MRFYLVFLQPLGQTGGTRCGPDSPQLGSQLFLHVLCPQASVLTSPNSLGCPHLPNRNNNICFRGCCIDNTAQGSMGNSAPHTVRAQEMLTAVTCPLGDGSASTCRLKSTSSMQHGHSHTTAQQAPPVSRLSPNQAQWQMHETRTRRKNPLTPFAPRSVMSSGRGLSLL